jgi:hypothetical protein
VPYALPTASQLRRSERVTRGYFFSFFGFFFSFFMLRPFATCSPPSHAAVAPPPVASIYDDLGEPVEDRGVLDEDAVARPLVGHPVGEEIEQHRVVRLVLLGGVRPVAETQRSGAALA